MSTESVERKTPPLTQPADPSPKKPVTPCPTGAIDCHIHLFGPAAKHPFHPDSKYTSVDQLPETNIHLQDTLGLAGAVVVSGGGYGMDTSHLCEVLEKYPGRFKGVALLPETVTREEIARLDKLGVRGARFVSPKHRGALPRLPSKIVNMLADFGWHVQFYPAADDLPDFADELLALPVPVVLDHFAALRAEKGVQQFGFQKLLWMLESGKVWVKLSGPMRCVDGDFPYMQVTPMARSLVAAAPERLVWGTDWPHVNMNGRGMPNDGDLFDLLTEWVPGAATRKRILVDNPRELYGSFS